MHEFISSFIISTLCYGLFQVILFRRTKRHKYEKLKLSTLFFSERFDFSEEFGRKWRFFQVVEYSKSHILSFVCYIFSYVSQAVIVFSS